MEPSEEELRSVALVYWNTFLMQKIIGNVENFADRDSLELTSKRLRALCLQTPITRRGRYSIVMIQPRNYKPPSHISIWRRIAVVEMYFSIRTCSDVPESESCEVMGFESLNHAKDIDIFFAKVQKRMPKQIHEFEIQNRTPGNSIMEKLEKMPNLKSFIFRDTRDHRSFDPWIEELQPDAKFVATHVESLCFQLTDYHSREIKNLKCMIGPGLKHFSCQIDPDDGLDQWFIEELMVDMALHNVQLETCQLLFTNPHMPCKLINALTHFLTEKSKVMHFTVSESAQLLMTDKLIPTVSVKLHCQNDFILRELLRECPNIFRKAEVLTFSNLWTPSFWQMVQVLPICYSARQIYISCAPLKDSLFVIDNALEKLPSSLKTLSLEGCKMSPRSLELIVNRVSENLESLTLSGNSALNSIRSLIKLLRDLPELRNLEFDLQIPQLIFPIIVEHQKLKRLVAKPEGDPSETGLHILRCAFENVEIQKISRLESQLVLSNRRQTDSK